MLCLLTIFSNITFTISCLYYPRNFKELNLVNFFKNKTLLYDFISDETTIKTLSGKPCEFPFKSGGITYKRSCVKVSDHDPGWCFVQGNDKLVKDKCIPTGG